MLVWSQKFFTWCSTFCLIKSNRTSYSVIFDIHVHKFCYIGTIRFVKQTFSRKFRKTIYCGGNVYFMAFVIVNWSTEINLYFLIRFSTSYMAVELFGGKYSFKILTNRCAGFTLCWSDYWFPIHVTAPKMCSHTYHAPGTWVTSMQIFY